MLTTLLREPHPRLLHTLGLTVTIQRESAYRTDPVFPRADLPDVICEVPFHIATAEQLIRKFTHM